MRELHDLDSEVVVVDVGGDNRDNLFDFFAVSAFRLLVTSREPAALQATYAFLKGAARRAERRHGGDARSVLARFSGGLVGNAIEAPEHEETFHAFSRLVREHLGIPLPVVGCLRTSERIAQSIVARQPLIVRRGIDDNVRQFHHMAEVIMNDEGAPGRDCALDGEPIDDRDGGRRASRRPRPLRAQEHPLSGRLGRDAGAGLGRDRGARPRRLGERRRRRNRDKAAHRRRGDLAPRPAARPSLRGRGREKYGPDVEPGRSGLHRRGRIPARLVAAARAAGVRPAS